MIAYAQYACVAAAVVAVVFAAGTGECSHKHSIDAVVTADGDENVAEGCLNNAVKKVEVEGKADVFVVAADDGGLVVVVA